MADIPKRAKRSKKNRKHGVKKEKPSHKRYTHDKRWEKNRERRIKKHLKATRQI